MPPMEHDREHKQLALTGNIISTIPVINGDNPWDIQIKDNKFYRSARDAI